MKLSKRGILKAIDNKSIVIEPFDYDNLNPNSYNVTLHNELMVYTDHVLDMKKENPTKTIIIPEEGYLLLPGELYLGRTVEWTKTVGLVPSIDGRSSTGRLGLDIHVCAGFGDNGFEGTWTLEIVCSNPTRVYKGMPVGRLYYYPLIGDADIEYRGKYYRQIDPTASKLNEEYSKEKGLVRERVNNKRN